MSPLPSSSPQDEFMKLPLADRIAAWEIARERKGPAAQIKIADMLKAHKFIVEA